MHILSHKKTVSVRSRGRNPISKNESSCPPSWKQIKESQCTHGLSVTPRLNQLRGGGAGGRPPTPTGSWSLHVRLPRDRLTQRCFFVFFFPIAATSFYSNKT